MNCSEERVREWAAMESQATLQGRGARTRPPRGESGPYRPDTTESGPRSGPGRKKGGFGPYRLRDAFHANREETRLGTAGRHLELPGSRKINFLQHRLAGYRECRRSLWWCIGRRDKRFYVRAGEEVRDLGSQLLLMREMAGALCPFDHVRGNGLGAVCAYPSDNQQDKRPSGWFVFVTQGAHIPPFVYCTISDAIPAPSRTRRSVHALKERPLQKPVEASQRHEAGQDGNPPADENRVFPQLPHDRQDN